MTFIIVGIWKANFPGRLTWNIQITHLERKMIFQTPMILFHVNLLGCSTPVTECQTRLSHRPRPIICQQLGLRNREFLRRACINNAKAWKFCWKFIWATETKTHTWWFKVTFLGWLSDPFKGLSDLQLGNQKVTLNHLAHWHSIESWLVHRKSRSWYIIPIWVFPKIGVPQNGWFVMENPLNIWMIWGYHYFRKHPYIFMYITR